jgi:hypothetical protein
MRAPLQLTRKQVFTAFEMLRQRGLHDFGGASTLALAFGWDWEFAQEVVHAYLIGKAEGVA